MGFTTLKEAKFSPFFVNGHDFWTLTYRGVGGGKEDLAN